MEVLEIVIFCILASSSMVSVIFLFKKQNEYPIKQKSITLQFIYICSFTFGQFILFFHNSLEDKCQLYIHNLQGQYHFKCIMLWANFDIWIYITIFIHYRLYILCKLQKRHHPNPAFFKNDGNYFLLSITNSPVLNKFICTILLNNFVAVCIVISIFLIKILFTWFFKSIYMYEQLDNEFFCLIFLHLLYLQNQVVHQFQSFYSIFGYYIIRLALEILSIGKWCKNPFLQNYIIYTIIILNTIIFVLQIVLPLFYSTPKPKIIDGEAIYTYFDECINHKFTKQIFQEYCRLKSNDQNLQLDEKNISENKRKYQNSFLKTISYKNLRKILRQNEKLHEVLRNLNLF